MLTRRNTLALMGIAGTLAARRARAQHVVRVVATFSILGDLVKNVGGERIEVSTLVKPNADVHVYSPTPNDVRSIAAATVVFVNGLGLEGWIARLISAAGTKASVVVASKGVKSLEIEDEGRIGWVAMDPHAWQSVANAKIYVANIRDSLTLADAANKDAYDASANVYLAKLDALEKEVREAINKISPERRKIIATHRAFRYFADAYGMEFIAPEGLATDAEPSAKDVARIIAQIRRQKIPAIFMENVGDPRLMQQIAKETGARIGGTLYSDALSEPNGPAGTYVDMMRHNVRELLEALGP
jgi:zinc/manganese transport system substrate-binding protein